MAGIDLGEQILGRGFPLLLFINREKRELQYRKEEGRETLVAEKYIT